MCKDAILSILLTCICDKGRLFLQKVIPLEENKKLVYQKISTILYN